MKNVVPVLMTAISVTIGVIVGTWAYDKFLKKS